MITTDNYKAAKESGQGGGSSSQGARRVSGGFYIFPFGKGNPANNVGVDLAKANLAVLDFDAGDAPSNIGLPPTLVIKTGRGQRWYYKGAFPQGSNRSKV